jgi:exonuclease-1
MGISGLLPVLKSIVEVSHVGAYRGMTVGVDASVWLHRGVYACAPALALGKRTDAYVRCCEAMLNLLLNAGAIPYIVFDGGYLPAKAGEEAERRASRETAMAAGLEAHRRGDEAAARALFVRAVDVTPAMAYQFMRVLRARGVAFVVAPYEADAQLAFLCKAGIVQVRRDGDGRVWVRGSRDRSVLTFAHSPSIPPHQLARPLPVTHPDLAACRR